MPTGGCPALAIGVAAVLLKPYTLSSLDSSTAYGRGNWCSARHAARRARLHRDREGEGEWSWSRAWRVT